MASIIDLSQLEDEDDDDEIIVLHPEPADNGAQQMEMEPPHESFRLLFSGEPVPKPSPRFNAKFMGFKFGAGGPFKFSASASKNQVPIIKRWINNPAEPKMKQVRDLAKHQLAGQLNHHHFPLINTSTVWIKLWFCKRPNNTYFINNDRQRPKGHLLNTTPYSPVTFPDTDNCVKFILDALKHVAWTDDNQVSKIIAYKCLDAIPPYEGRTVVEFGPHGQTEAIPAWVATYFI